MQTSARTDAVTGVGSVEITITAAQLLAARATPIVVIAKPGPGRIIQFLGGMALAANGAAYVVGTNDLVLRYKDGTGKVISQVIDTAGLLDQTTKIMTQIMPVTVDSKVASTDCENQPIVLQNSGAAELTTGTGVLRLKLQYLTYKAGW